MTSSRTRLAIVATLVLVANFVFGMSSVLWAEPEKCPEQVQVCFQQSHCSFPGYPQCNICFPNPFGPHCTFNEN